MNGLIKAVHLYGSRRALAADLKVTGEAVRKWERGRVPAERCRDIVRVVNERHPGALSLHDLRPDLWPSASAPSEAA